MSDSDSDSAMADDELMTEETLKASFKAADANGDGFISKDELKTVFQSLGSWTDEEFDQLYVAADTNSDSKLDYNEFVEWVMYSGAAPEACGEEKSKIAKSESGEKATDTPAKCEITDMQRLESDMIKNVCSSIEWFRIVDFDEHIKADPDVWCAALDGENVGEYGLEYAADSLRKDKDFFLRAISLCPNAFKNFAECIKANPGLVLEGLGLCKRRGTQRNHVLSWSKLEDALKGDVAFAKKAVEVEPWSYALFNKDVRTDFAMREAALQADAKQFLALDDATKLLETYSGYGALNAAVANGSTCLLNATWFCKWMEDGNILPRRQELPDEAIFRGPVQLETTLVVALTYCWGNLYHPDEFGHQMKDFASVVKWFLGEEESRELLEAQLRREIALMIDFAALPQHGVKYLPGTICDVRENSVSLRFECAPENEIEVGNGLIKEIVEAGGKSLDLKESMQVSARMPRSQEEARIMKTGLQAVNYWYANQQVIKTRLSKLPEGCIKRKPYLESGWPYFEFAAASMITDSKNLCDASALKVQDLSGVIDRHMLSSQSKINRTLPIHPDTFTKDLQTKHFTNGADSSFVAGKYEKTFNQVVRPAKSLLFEYMSVSAEAWATFFKEVLPLCDAELLDLMNNESLSVDVESFPPLPKLKSLYVSYTSLGGDIETLATACPNLEILWANTCPKLTGDATIFYIQLAELNTLDLEGCHRVINFPKSKARPDGIMRAPDGSMATYDEPE